MALLANGFHIAIHAGALVIAAADYSFAKVTLPAPQYSFGIDKVGDLFGFASTLIFGLVAIAIESLVRFAQEIRDIIEQSGDTKITDLHVWQFSSEAHAAIASVLGNTSVTGDVIRERLVPMHEVTHLAVELRSA